MSGVPDDELIGRIELKVFRSVRGLKGRFVGKLDLAFEIRDLTKLQCMGL